MRTMLSIVLILLCTQSVYSHTHIDNKSHCDNPPVSNNTATFGQWSSIFLTDQFTCPNNTEKASVKYNVASVDSPTGPSFFAVLVYPTCNLLLNPTPIWSEYYENCSKPQTSPIYTNANSACIVVQCEDLLINCKITYDVAYNCS